MNSEDRKYLRALGKMRPGYEVFKEMVQMLTNIQAKTEQILKVSLLSKV